jgi:hypothetical protein
MWHAINVGVPDSTLATDLQFGNALAAGEFDHGGRDDRVIGAPNRTVAGYGYAGSVYVLYGTAGGLGTARTQLWSQASSGVFSEPENWDRFGQGPTRCRRVPAPRRHQ